MENTKYQQSPLTEAIHEPKKPYTPPQLAVFGDVRDVTMGVSPGVGESGNPVVFRI